MIWELLSAWDSHCFYSQINEWRDYLSATQRWPMGLDVSVRPGWTPVWPCWASPEPPDTFSSSLLLRQAALGFKFRSVSPEKKWSFKWNVLLQEYYVKTYKFIWCIVASAIIKLSLAGHGPLTCCSKLSMTATAWWRMSSFVWGFSLFRCSWHMRPSSLNASLMSRTLRRSRALLAILLSRSRSAFCSGFRSSSSVML